jgi:hypothetical protein
MLYAIPRFTLFVVGGGVVFGGSTVGEEFSLQPVIINKTIIAEAATPRNKNMRTPTPF